MWPGPEVETAHPQLADLQAGNVLVPKGCWAKAEGMCGSWRIPSEGWMLGSEQLTPGALRIGFTCPHPVPWTSLGSRMVLHFRGLPGADGMKTRVGSPG